MKSLILKNKVFFFTSLFIALAFSFSCATTSQKTEQKLSEQVQHSPVKLQPKIITLLFAGDIMAHSINSSMTDYNLIWNDIRDEVKAADLSFGNLESPFDSTKEASSFPNFNMPVSYVQAAIDAGFNVFSLANNHSFDQFESGLYQTIKSAELLEKKNPGTYFSGLKKSKNENYSYNLIEKNGWKILFLPVTEILNYPHDYALINYVAPKEKDRKKFIEFCKNLKNQTNPDIFVLSLHANEPEYVRTVTKSQQKWYKELCDEGGVDVLWANHAHLVKDRIRYKNKVILCANGNTISAQRTRPDFLSAVPNGERDNTGDGILYEITFEKNQNNEISIQKAQTVWITTYINTAWHFIIKKMDDNFVNYLYDIERTDWAEYIKKRIKINKDETKDIVWQ